MYLDDKILKCEEITDDGEFSLPTGGFYLFLAPRAGSAESMVGILSAKATRNEVLGDIPFSLGVWNPIVISLVRVTASDLQQYRIWWGTEYK